MQASIGFNFNNTYNVKLIDSTSGEVKQSGTFHNIVTENFMRILGGMGSNAFSNYANGYAPLWGLRDMLSRIAVGSGSAEPSYTDSRLSNKLWSANASTREYEWIDDYTIRGTASYVFPANSSYAATISEVGLVAFYTSSYGSGSYYDDYLITRSLFTDSEGQPISFEKTDLDILEITVTVEVSIRSDSEDFTIYKKPFLLGYIVGLVARNGYGLEFGNTGGIDLRRYYYDLENMPEATVSTEQSANGGGSYTASATYDGTQAQINVPQVRLGTHVITSERYYKAVALPFLGYWKLPNENVFPAYNISNIQVGVGNGSTTTFENPLNYFKADSDKVYKNGQLLVRGVDYVLNNLGNKDCLPELNDLIAPIKVTTDLDLTSEVFVNNTNNYVPLMRASYNSFKRPGQFNKNIEAYCFDANSPLYVEYEEAVTLNCLKFTRLYYSQISGSYGNYGLPSGTTLSIDFSHDGDVYEEVTTSTIENSYTGISIDFADTSAKYWRIRTSFASGNGSTRNVIHLATQSDAHMTLNRKDSNIVFTEAPAEGDVITMDVDMDVIMKNGNFVADIGCSFIFTM